MSQLIEEEEEQRSIRIIYDPAKTITPSRETDTYTKMIGIRLKEIKKLLEKTKIMENVYTISQIQQQIQNKNLKQKRWNVLGVLLEKKTLQNYGILIIEDETGIIVAKTPIEITHKIIPDDIILADIIYNDRTKTFYTKKVELASERTIIKMENYHNKLAKTQTLAVFLSDIHADENYESVENFKKFINWLINTREEKEIKKKIKYIFISGDIIDCNIRIETQKKQREYYMSVFELLEKIDENISTIIIPGECDSTNTILPQEPIKKQFRPSNRENYYFLGNPVIISIERGIRILLYHGQSIPYIIQLTGVIRPAEAVREYVKRRTLHVTLPAKNIGHYTVLPDTTGNHILNTLPDIVHCGHIHLPDALRANNILYITTPNWSRDKKKDLFGYMPRVAIVDLRDFNVLWRGL